MIKLQSAFKEGVENWELSMPLEEISIVADSEYEGKSLVQYVQDEGKEILGTKYDSNQDSSRWMKLIEEACQRADLEGNEASRKAILDEHETLHIEVIDIEEEIELVADETSFHSIIVLEGSSHILSSKKKMTLGKGDLIFLPAGYGTYCIVGTCKVIISTIR